MDKELIAMCDTDEIQGKWGYEEGSQYILDGDGVVIVAYGVDMKDTIAKYPQDKRTYIPSIENVLEWETVGGLRTIARAMEAIMDYVAKHELWDYPLLQTCLVYHMERAHGKSWDLKDRAWI